MAAYTKARLIRSFLSPKVSEFASIQIIQSMRVIGKKDSFMAKVNLPGAMDLATKETIMKEKNMETERWLLLHKITMKDNGKTASKKAMASYTDKMVLNKRMVPGNKASSLVINDNIISILWLTIYANDQWYSKADRLQEAFHTLEKLFMVEWCMRHILYDFCRTVAFEILWELSCMLLGY